MNDLKLFVVGSSDTKPDHWNGPYALVIAKDAIEAKHLCGDLPVGDSVTEIVTSKPLLLHYQDLAPFNI